MKIIFSSVAEREIRDSFQWYENQTIGIGRKFVEVIDKTIKFILFNPKGYPEKHPPYREIAINKFPYLIIYEIDEENQTIYILRVFHTRRNPKLKYRK